MTHTPEKLTAASPENGGYPSSESPLQPGCYCDPVTRVFHFGRLWGPTCFHHSSVVKLPFSIHESPISSLLGKGKKRKKNKLCTCLLLQNRFRSVCTPTYVVCREKPQNQQNLKIKIVPEAKRKKKKNVDQSPIFPRGIALKFEGTFPCNQKNTHLLQGSLHCQPKQCIIVREIPEKYHRFVLFDSPQMGNDS